MKSTVQESGKVFFNLEKNTQQADKRNDNSHGNLKI
jgi:hypothetical protein